MSNSTEKPQRASRTTTWMVLLAVVPAVTAGTAYAALGSGHALSLPSPSSWFGLSLSAQSPAGVTPGGTATYTVTISRRRSFRGPVALAMASGLPTGVTASFNPIVATGSSSTLALTTRPTTPPGSYPVTVEGRGGGRVERATGSLKVDGGGGDTSFEIAGSPPTGLLLIPGGALVPVNLVFTNPNASAITIRSVTTTVTGTSAPACGAANFSVAQQLTAQPVVPASTSRSLQDLGVPQSQWPQLQMADAGNQDACENANVSLSFSGSAQG